MYEENNSQDKPVVIGIDHGFSLMKTKDHIFGNGVVRCNGRPPVAENSFYYDGSYYCIGWERKTVHEDKTADEDYVITIENVYCFPQCFAAVADCMGNMHGDML